MCGSNPCGTKGKRGESPIIFMHKNGGNEMENTMKVSIGMACISVLVLCTGAVPAGKKEKFEARQNKLLDTD